MQFYLFSAKASEEWNWLIWKTEMTIWPIKL